MLVRSAKVAGLVVWTACAAVPQDIEPEILLLSRIKNHLREELAHIPNYTCLETINRFRGDHKSAAQSGKAPPKFDTIQLEIVYSDGKEWYGSPGAAVLSVENPVAFIGGGMIGNGAFGISMHNLVEGGIFKYRGEDVGGGRRSVKYDFRIPALTKPLLITMEGASGVVGEAGSIWADPDTFDLIRMESHAVEVPPYLPIEEVSMTVEYARTSIAGTDTLLAQAAESRLIDDTGLESYNRMEFTHCHSYSTSSAITFDTRPAPTAESAPAAPALGAAVPPFLQVTIELTKPITNTDSVGSLIHGKVAGDVIRKGRVVVPDGSLIHGRIRALDHYPDLGVFAVGLEFTDVEVGGDSMPFYADFLRVNEDPRISLRVWTHGKNNPRTMDKVRTVDNLVITQPELPGVASFYVKGANFTLSPGFRMVWRTRGLLR